MQTTQIRVPTVRHRVGVVLATGALLLGTTLAIGCVGQNDRGNLGNNLAQPATTQTILPAATAAVTGTGTITPQATNPATTATTEATPGSTGTITAAETVTLTVPVTPTDTVIEGTPTPRPVPTGEPPDPESRLNMYQFYQTNNTLVRRDYVQLDGSGDNEILYTLTGPDPVITTEQRSNINVLTYDPVYREWSIAWESIPVSGTASPLLSWAQSNLGGLNGGPLLGGNTPVFAIRTTTSDNRAHLFLYRWDAAAKTADPLKMVQAVGGAETNAIFDADLDVNLADLNNDNVYEVVADNIAGVQIWRWDGQKFVPEVAR